MLTPSLQAVGREAIRAGEEAKYPAGPRSAGKKACAAARRITHNNRVPAHLSGAVLVTLALPGARPGRDVRSPLRTSAALCFVVDSADKSFWWVHLPPSRSWRHVRITARVLQTCALVGDISITVENPARAKCWTSEKFMNALKQITVDVRGLNLV